MLVFWSTFSAPSNDISKKAITTNTKNKKAKEQTNNFFKTKICKHCEIEFMQL